MVFPLRGGHVVLGRYEEADHPDSFAVMFHEPTVSRVHAILEWEERRARYVVHHRSRTNPTILNGAPLARPHVLEPGDTLKMGSTLVMLRQSPLSPWCGTGGGVRRALVVLSGPDRGRVCPLVAPQAALVDPERANCGADAIVVNGMQGWNIEMILHNERLFVQCEERVGLLSRYPGLVSCRLVGTRDRIPLQEGMVVVCGDVAFLVASADRALAVSRLLEAGEETGDPLVDFVRPGPPPYWESDDPCLLRILSGPDRGSTLWIDPTGVHGPVLVGRSGPGGLHVEVPDRNAADLMISFSSDGVHLENVDSTESVYHNWDLLRPGEGLELLSGDRITMGRSVLSFETVPLQACIESYAVFLGTDELPLVRAVNTLGYRPENELRVDDRRLAPRHGVLEVRDSGEVAYVHMDTECVVRIGDAQVRAGEEYALCPGDVIHLTDEVEVSFGRRVSTHRPSDPVLIGPTQREIEEERMRITA